MAKRKSSAVTGVPSLQLAFFRRWKVYSVWVLSHSQRSATPGTASPFSSRRQRPSNREPITSRAAVPEAVWGSKLLTAPGRGQTSSPSFWYPQPTAGSKRQRHSSRQIRRFPMAFPPTNRR